MVTDEFIQFSGINDRLKALDILLPSMPKPSGNYDPFVFSPPFLYISGVTPKHDGVMLYKGKIGRDFTKEEGYAAARQCVINQLSVMESALGSLDRVQQVVKVVGFVNTDGDFHDLPTVINGASDLLVSVFAERGRHARSAVGVSSLPGGAAVEIEMIVKVKP
jgi:enamine deaminase RidA (YjgF/YER057c/UK114 family)